MGGMKRLYLCTCFRNKYQNWIELFVWKAMLDLEYFAILGEVMQRFTFGTLLFTKCTRTEILLSKMCYSLWRHYRNLSLEPSNSRMTLKRGWGPNLTWERCDLTALLLWNPDSFLKLLGDIADCWVVCMEYSPPPHGRDALNFHSVTMRSCVISVAKIFFVPQVSSQFMAVLVYDYLLALTAAICLIFQIKVLQWIFHVH